MKMTITNVLLITNDVIQMRVLWNVIIGIVIIGIVINGIVIIRM